MCCRRTCSAAPDLIAGNTSGRSFTPYQRLLTETRILNKYFGGLFLPRAFSGGLFNDNIAVSTGVFDPPTTFISIIALVALGGIAVAARRRAPAISLAIAFYFAGQVLESTYLPLELYFEHRNYLSAILLPFPVAWYLIVPRYGYLAGRIVTIVVLLGILTFQTSLRTELWGRPYQQAAIWVARNPGSSRAKIHLAQLSLQTGKYAQAEQLLSHALQRDPSNLIARFLLIRTTCHEKQIDRSQINRLERDLRTADLTLNVRRYQLGTILSGLRESNCTTLTPTVMAELLDAASHNSSGKANSAWRQEILEQRGQLHLDQGDPDAAYHSFLKALQVQPVLDGTLKDAALMASRGYPRRALALLDAAPRPRPDGLWPLSVARLRRAWLRHTGYYRKEIARLRTTIESDLRLSARETTVPLRNPVPRRQSNSP